jgi:hypothetical protein
MRRGVRRWWLGKFEDAELGEMAEALTGREPDLEHLAAERERLAVALALPSAR